MAAATNLVPCNLPTTTQLKSPSSPFTPPNPPISFSLNPNPSAGFLSSIHASLKKRKSDIQVRRSTFVTRSSISHHCGLRRGICSLLCRRNISLLARVCSDDGQVESFAAQKQSPDIQGLRDNSSSSQDSYVSLFIRLLGLDNDTQDREQAVVALWKYSLGGKNCVDNIMKYHGTVNLIVNLLKSSSDSACEAAAGLLRVISSINLYRDIVAGSAAIEEITGLLRHSSLSYEVKEQALCTLWNLSVDEKVTARIANSEILPLIIKSLDDEYMAVKEAAAGVLANLTLSQSNHKVMVEAGVIPKLTKLLTLDPKESKVIKKTARSALLELAKDQYNRILVLEEGLVVVPLIGAEAYKSFRPSLYSWPSLPDGTKIEQRPNGPSKYGASELLIGLNVDNKNVDLEEAKTKAVVGRTQQQFLARIGAIETEDDNKSNSEGSSSQNSTLLPWTDAVARLVLILGLENESAIAKAAETIAGAAITERMRIAFKEAGAIKNLVELINHPNDTVKLAVIRALEKLSISNSVCQTLEAEGILHPLINELKQSRQQISHDLTTMIISILSRILDPNKEMKSKFYNTPLTDSRMGWDNNETISSNPLSSSYIVAGENFIDSTFLSSLVDILKTNPDLERKTCSILEFIVVIEPSSVEKLTSAGIESALEAIFQQKSLTGSQNGIEDETAESHILELEESGLAVSAAARLLTKLLDHDKFQESVNSHHFTKLLRTILVSDIPLENKNWVASCLVKLSSLSSNQGLLFEENPVNMEVTLYETIPRLIEQMNSTSFLGEVQRAGAAVLELNRIISEGSVDYSRAVASGGGIFPLVKLMESGDEQVVEASLAILHNLSMDSENHPAIIAAGAVPVLRKLVLSQRPHWTRALHLLRILPT
ncbi:uncharacterized protein LOC127244864 [Andrographis paniculata]|uniref:uncharacterized protein LOC127244864 n=1 Tax=Andrographis paniculata TaxID=175694 RepID=UPI0021E78572|nr:uncharacterized protein LOC127244864 [Andrographis paniculata]